MFFFFKQKTAYELRISDWGSDVCSSDLVSPAITSIRVSAGCGILSRFEAYPARKCERCNPHVQMTWTGDSRHPWNALRNRARLEIGRASCRERVCKYV